MTMILTLVDWMIVVILGRSSDRGGSRVAFFALSFPWAACCWDWCLPRGIIGGSQRY